jgi:hypothetical protein
MHDSDVLERVLGLDLEPEAEDVRTEVIDLAVLPWLSGVTVSSVQLTVGGVPPRKAKPKSRR